MPELPTIASMWIGPTLSFLDQLCLKSFVDAGHQTKLYVYGDVENVPDGVEVSDASIILPSDHFVMHKASGSPGPHADRFRYHLLQQTREIWVDTDCYCVRPFPDSDYLFATHWKDRVTNAVLRLPANSPTLKDLIRFTSEEYPVLPDDFPFLRPRTWSLYKSAVASGQRAHVSELEWEIWGPFALTYFLHRHDEFRHRITTERLYPLMPKQIKRAIRLASAMPQPFPVDCLSVHFFGSTVREVISSRGGVPLPGTHLDKLCRLHGIDPSAAPMTNPVATAA